MPRALTPAAIFLLILSIGPASSVRSQVPIVVNADGAAAGPHLDASPGDAGQLTWIPADHPGLDPAPSRPTVKGVPFPAPERLTVDLPLAPAYLAQPLVIPLQLTGGQVVALTIVQSNVTGALHNQPTAQPFIAPTDDPRASSPATAPPSPLTISGATLTHNQGPAKTIEVLPLQTGRVTLDITATFTDGAFARQAFTLQVAPSARGLKRLSLLPGSTSLPLIYQGKPKDAEALLVPQLVYQQLRDPISLPDARDLKFAVSQSRDEPVLRLDPNGAVHALRFGETSITGDFAGVKDTISVTVYTTRTAPPRPRLKQKKPAVSTLTRPVL